ncbi:MAG: hypothetical protein ACYC6V_02220, partial [Bacillota bacterium]
MADGPSGWTRLASGDHVAAFYHDAPSKAALIAAFVQAPAGSVEATFTIGCGGNELSPEEYLSAEGGFSLPRLKEALSRRARDSSLGDRPLRLAVDAHLMAERVRNGFADHAFSLQVWEE